MLSYPSNDYRVTANTKIERVVVQVPLGYKSPYVYHVPIETEVQNKDGKNPTLVNTKMAAHLDLTLLTNERPAIHTCEYTVFLEKNMFNRASTTRRLGKFTLDNFYYYTEEEREHIEKAHIEMLVKKMGYDYIEVAK